MEYKLSQFLIEKDLNDNISLFNTLIRSLVVINKDLYEEIKDSKITDMGQLNKLTELGVIVEKDIDEYKYYRYLYNKEKFNANTLTITFLVTRECNLACKYCFENNNNKVTSEIDIYKIVDKLLIGIEDYYEKRKFEYLDFNFFGGEPTLDIDTMSSIIHNIKIMANNKGFKFSFHLVTNGYLLDEKVLELLKEIGIESMQITIDGDKNSHNKNRILRNGDGTFDVVYNNMLRAIDYGFDIILNISYDDENYVRIKELLKGIPDKYKGRLYIKYTEIVKTANNNVVPLTVNERIHIKKELYLEPEIKKYNMVDIEYIEDGPCLFNKRNTIIIDANGDISKCLFGIDDNQFIIGNIFKENLFEIVNTNYMEYMTEDKSNQCRGCVVLPICKEGCYRQKKAGINNCSRESILVGEVKMILNLLLEEYI